MILTRTAAGMVKSVLHPVKPPYSWMVTVLKTPSRKITKGRTDMQFRKPDGKMPSDEIRPPLHALFIGRFEEKSCKHEREFNMALGLTKKQHKAAKELKSWISYSLDGDTWTYTAGYIGSDKRFIFPFKSGQEFMVTFKLLPVKYLITVKDNVITEKQTNLRDPDIVVHVIKTVEGNTLTDVSTLKDVVMKRVYKRVKEH